jgi:hypothetical protein
LIHLANLTRDRASLAWIGARRWFYLLVIATAAGLLVFVLGEESGKVPRAASPALPVQGIGDDGCDPSLDIRALKEDISTLERAGRSLHEALAALETRVSALEGDLRSRSEHHEIQGSAVLTNEEFERRYEGPVRAILERTKAEEAKLADARTVRYALSPFIKNLNQAQAEELFLLCLEVRADILELEKRFAPHGVAPDSKWPDYQLMTAAWWALLDKWLPAIARFTGDGFALAIIRDLTPLSLFELKSMAYR